MTLIKTSLSIVKANEKIKIINTNNKVLTKNNNEIPKFQPTTEMLKEKQT